MSIARNGFLLLVSLTALLSADSARAQTINYTYEGDYVNDGSTPATYTRNPGSSYATGVLGNLEEYRSFFSFDLSSINFTGKQVVSATFTITRAGYLTVTSRPSQPLLLSAVSTAAATLNTGGSNSANGAIFTDLGDGNVYANYNVLSSGNTTDLLNIPLSASALTDIRNRAGGFFSLGGIITTAANDFGEAAFVSSGAPNTAQLTLVLAPVPEPSFPLVAGVGALGTTLLALRARRRVS